MVRRNTGADRPMTSDDVEKEKNPREPHHPRVGFHRATRPLAILVGLGLLVFGIWISMISLDYATDVITGRTCSGLAPAERDACWTAWGTIDWPSELARRALAGLAFMLSGVSLVAVGRRKRSLNGLLVGTGLVLTWFTGTTALVAGTLNEPIYYWWRFYNGFVSTQALETQTEFWTRTSVVVLLIALACWVALFARLWIQADRKDRQKSLDSFETEKAQMVETLRNRASRLLINGKAEDARRLTTMAEHIQSLSFGWSLHEGRDLLEGLENANNAARAGRKEDAAVAFESLGLLETSGELRQPAPLLVEERRVSIDVNRLVDQLRQGGLALRYTCPSCQAALDLETVLQGSRNGPTCNYCGTSLRIVEIEGFLRKYLRG